jgi:hypothetical protein
MQDFIHAILTNWYNIDYGLGAGLLIGAIKVGAANVREKKAKADAASLATDIHAIRSSMER